MQNGVSFNHLVSAEGVLEYALEHVDHHTEAVLEVDSVPGLLLEQVFDKLLHDFVVASAVNGRDVQELSNVKQLVIVHNTSIEIHAEVLMLRLHVLRQAIKHFEDQLELLADERLKLSLHILSATAELTTVEIERLIEVNLQLIQVIILPDILQKRIKKVYELWNLRHEEPKANERQLRQKL